MKRTLVSALLSAALVGCGSSSSQQLDAGADSNHDASPAMDGANASHDGGGDAPGESDAGGSTHTLTINNFLSWCAITVTQPAGATLAHPATSATNGLTEPAGTVVTLHGAPANASFEWVPAGGTGGWSGAIDPGQDAKAESIQVTLDGDKTVDVCCPFTDGSGC